MVNNIKKRRNIIPGTFVLFLLMFAVNCFAEDSSKKLNGTFIQPMLCANWTDKEWQNEFTALKNAGMHYIVIGNAADCNPGRKVITIYPSSLSNTKMLANRDGKQYPDIIDACLRNAEAAGIKVFIGIGINEKWWKNEIDTSWLYPQMQFDNEVCDELWKLYKNKYPSAFYGWYWAYEIANFSYSQNKLDAIAGAINIQLDHLAKTNEKLPFMWCPYMNAKIGAPDQYRVMWEYIFSKLHLSAGDIFAPQDCIGAGGLTLEELNDWFSALRKAVNTKPGLEFWSDLETFDHTDWSSASISRIVKQIKAEQPYVDNFITFAYSHYQSPNVTDSGFQKTYIDYLKNDSIEAVPPSMPESVAAEQLKDGSVRLTWNSSTDNIGVWGYYIYRNGVRISKKIPPIVYGRKQESGLSITFTDTNVVNGKKYIYNVQAFDYAENVSPFSGPVTINIR